MISFVHPTVFFKSQLHASFYTIGYTIECCSKQESPWYFKQYHKCYICVSANTSHDNLEKNDVTLGCMITLIYERSDVWT